MNEEHLERKKYKRGLGNYSPNIVIYKELATKMANHNLLDGFALYGVLRMIDHAFNYGARIKKTDLQKYLDTMPKYSKSRYYKALNQLEKSIFLQGIEKRDNGDIVFRLKSQEKIYLELFGEEITDNTKVFIPIDSITNLSLFRANLLGSLSSDKIIISRKKITELTGISKHRQMRLEKKIETDVEHQEATSNIQANQKIVDGLNENSNSHKFHLKNDGTLAWQLPNAYISKINAIRPKTKLQVKPKIQNGIVIKRKIFCNSDEQATRLQRKDYKSSEGTIRYYETQSFSSKGNKIWKAVL